MKRVALFVLALALPLAAQSSSNDSKLERIRKMSPEERARFQKLLEQYKKLPEEERQRLRENLGRLRELPPAAQKKLKEELRRLSPEDQKMYREVAAGFFQDRARRNLEEARLFPRMLFFHWIKNQQGEAMEQIKALAPAERPAAFAALVQKFRVEAAQHTLQHAKWAKNPRNPRKHDCFSESDAEALRDTAPEKFWARWRDVADRCPNAPKRPPQRR